MNKVVCSRCGGTGFEPESLTTTSVKELAVKILNILDTPRTKVTPGRVSKLKNRLKTFTPDEIERAANNLSKSDFHMGVNDNNTKYATIDFLLRNDEKLDEWLNREEAKRVYA